MAEQVRVSTRPTASRVPTNDESQVPDVEESPMEYPAAVPEEVVVKPPTRMTVKVGDMVHMNGILYDVPGGVYTWRAMSPTYHWVAVANAHLPGASFLAEEVGTYHMYLDVVTGQVDIPVTVTE